jgi:hypothetical protein
VQEPEEAKQWEIRGQTYVDALSDFGIKRLFGEEPNKELLIDFLNELLKSQGKQIVELHYIKNEHLPRVEEGRTAVYDLTCKGKNGEQFIIEVQRAHQEYFIDRTVFYLSNVISMEGRAGPKWRYQLREVCFIALTDFKLAGSDPGGYLSKTIFQKVFAIAEIANLTKEDYMRYTREQMELTDRYAILESAKEKGWKEGRQTGEKEGRKEGQREEREKIIRSLPGSGKFTTDEVAAYLQVSEVFVENIKTNMRKD